MRLTELEPEFVRAESPNTYQRIDTIESADGVLFLCPKCFADKAPSRRGVHYILCWRPHVPQTYDPKPGRWDFQGTGYGDLTLVAGSSSILLTSGCKAHFFVRNGEIVGA